MPDPDAIPVPTSRGGYFQSQIALRITLAFVPVMVIVLATFGAATAVRESEVITAELQRDADDVATAIAVLLAPDLGIDVARARVAPLGQALPHLRIQLRPTGEAAHDTPEPHSVRAIAPVAGGAGGPSFEVVVSESLAERDDFLVRSIGTDILATLAATLVAAALALAIGRNLVQQRVVRLTARLEAVGRGEYPDGPLDLGADELGHLGVATERMTRQLRRAQEHARSEEVARQRAQLQLRRADRLAAVGRTVAVFAHEVGTPLAVIRGRADRLLQPREPEVVVRDAAAIQEQADRIAAFVRRLLDYTRHEDGFVLQPVELRAVVERATRMAEHRVDHQNIALHFLDGPEVVVDGDAQALLQAVVNLMNNAIDASPDDGTVTVALAVEACTAGSERGLRSPHVHIRVIDEGTGIPTDIAARAFDPFFTTKDADRGTGLGLSIVREIVQDHAGVVTLENRAEGGCVAMLHLPLAGGTLG